MGRYKDIKQATAEVVGIRVLRKVSTEKAHAAIRDVIVANPGLSYQQIADLLACSRWLVYQSRSRVRRPPTQRRRQSVSPQGGAVKRKKYFDGSELSSSSGRTRIRTESGTAMPPLWQQNLTCLKMLRRRS